MVARSSIYVCGLKFSHAPTSNSTPHSIFRHKCSFQAFFSIQEQLIHYALQDECNILARNIVTHLRWNAVSEYFGVNNKLSASRTKIPTIQKSKHASYEHHVRYEWSVDYPEKIQPIAKRIGNTCVGNSMWKNKNWVVAHVSQDTSWHTLNATWYVDSFMWKTNCQRSHKDIYILQQ